MTGDPILEELLFWRLQTLGCQGTVSQIQDQVLTVKAYRPQKQVEVEALEDLAALLHQDAGAMGCAPITVRWDSIAEADWANNWKAHWQPQAIGDRLLIYPAWLPEPDATERLVLRLNPGAAFGTGEHATTQLCLKALETQLASHQTRGNTVSIADIGCGSGILSIAAVLLGAEGVYAVDTDPLAVDSARENRDLNSITAHHLRIDHGSTEVLCGMLARPVDGLVCNILADVIEQLIPQFARITQPQGWGILSGILKRQVWGHHQDAGPTGLAGHGHIPTRRLVLSPDYAALRWFPGKEVPVKSQAVIKTQSHAPLWSLSSVTWLLRDRRLPRLDLQ